MTDQNTRPQPSAEPVAVWREAYTRFNATIAMTNEDGNQAAAAVIASALEAARREDQARIAELEACIDLVIPDDCKSQLHEDATNMLKLQARIAALEADNARLMGLVKEAGEALDRARDWVQDTDAEFNLLNARQRTLDRMDATLAKIKESTDGRVTD